MPDVTELLERLAEQPPSTPLPVDEIRARARHRRQRHRRRVASASGLGVVMVVALAVAGVRVLDRSAPEVGTGGSGVEPAPEAPTLVESRGGLALTPAGGLDDGDPVALSLDPDPGGEVVATQCAAEVLDFTDEGRDETAGSRSRQQPREPARLLPTDFCGSTFYLRSPAGRPDLTMEVSRLQRTPSGEVDCASAPGRCVVMVGDGPVGDRFAPLVFAEDLAPVPPPTLELEGVDGPVEDGQLVRVVGRDFSRSRGDEVEVMQCIGEAGDTFDDSPVGRGGDDPLARCDLARTVTAPLAPDGTFTTEVRVFREIVTYESVAAQPDAPWAACEPCVLVAGDTPLPIEVVGSGEPIRPTLEITPGGSHRPGQRVQVEGAGFQPGQEVGISWCPAGSWEACQFPDEGFTATGEDGRFTVDGYPLPAADQSLGGTCTSQPGACVLAWAPSADGAPPTVTIPLDLSG